MSNDPRCCGTDTCLINADGACWCGQQWDGEKMCYPALKTSTGGDTPSTSDSSASRTPESDD